MFDDNSKCFLLILRRNWNDFTSSELLSAVVESLFSVTLTFSMLSVGAQWRAESIADVCDLGILAVVANYCDNVELHLVWQMVIAHISVGSIHHVSDFGWSNGIEWIYHSVECSGFYFYDDYPVAFLGNDVDFELIEPPITLAHDIAILYEVFGCHVLPYLS